MKGGIYRFPKGEESLDSRPVGETWMRDSTTSSTVQHMAVHKRLRKKGERGGPYVHWYSEGPA